MSSGAAMSEPVRNAGPVDAAGGFAGRALVCGRQLGFQLLDARGFGDSLLYGGGVAGLAASTA